MRTFTILFLILLSNTVWSQNLIKGVVVGPTGALQACHVYNIDDPDQGAYTNELGEFQFEVDDAFPLTIEASYVGLVPVQMRIDAQNAQNVVVVLEDEQRTLNTVVVGASRYEERIIEAPVAIYKKSSTQLKSAGGADHYEAIANMRGIQAQTSSLFFQSYNTRGFSDPGNFRFKQQMDGYDMTNPIGLAISNTMGVSDLDIASAEIVHGASSALYGSDAFNGVLRLYSKNPFDFPGVSLETKVGATVQDAAGTNPYFEQSLRVAHLFSDQWAFKFDFNYKRAFDWLGNDDSHRIPTGAWDNKAAFENLDINDPNGYATFDAVHRLGDEFGNGVGVIGFPVTLTAPDGSELNFAPRQLSRSGIWEEDLFTTADFASNEMTNVRANFSFFYRPTKDWELEYTYKHSFSDWLIRSSATFPQFDYLQRFHMFRASTDKFNFRVYNHKLDNFRGSWSASNAADAIQRALRSDEDWVADLQEKYAETGNLKEARDFADRFMPGGSEFNKEDFEAALGATSQNTDYSGLNSTLIPGSQAVDFSNYTNVDVDYDFKDALPVQLQVGLNYRNYNIESGGAFYNDGPLGFGEPIQVNQFAGYAQASKELLDDRLKITAALRADKQTDYNLNLSPRATAVVKLGRDRNHIVRGSYLTGFRNPSIQEGFFRLQLTSVFTIIGAAERSFDNFIYQGRTGTQYTLREILDSDEREFKALQPEQNTSYELGYRTILRKRLMIDVSGYYTEYENFINRPNLSFKPGTPDFQIFAIRQNRPETVQGYGAGLGLDYLLTDNWVLGASYDWSDYNSPDFEPTNEMVDDDVEKEAFLRSLQFNIPEHRINLSLNGKNLGPKKLWGVSLNWRQQSSFNYFSNFGELEIPSFNNLDLGITYKIPSWDTTLKVGGTNVLRQEYFTIYGAPLIGSVYYVAFRYEPK